VLLATDEFLTATDDPRLGWIAVAIVLKLTSVRGLSVGDIANQLGVSAAAIHRCTAKFAKMANLDRDGGLGSVQPFRSNDEKPDVIQA
jgi:hypothetical protein